MTAVTFMFAALSPLLVALLKRCNWPVPVTELLSFGVVVVLYVLALWLDQMLRWPIGPEFWEGLFAAWGVQQIAYKAVLRQSVPVQELERF